MARKIVKKKKVYDIIGDVNEYHMLRQRKKVISRRMGELSSRIKDYAMEKGTKDNNGSMYCTDDDNYIYGAMSKKSIKLNEEKAKTFLVDKGLYAECVQTIEKIDEDKVSELVQQGKLTLDELENLMDIKVTYSLDVKEKKQEEEMPEITPSKLVK